MRSKLYWLLSTAALGIAAVSCSDDDDVVERRLVVLFTTDEHSQLFAAAPEKDDFPLASTAGKGALEGGVARRMTILAAEREAARARSADVITLSAGDFSQGSLASAAWLATSPELVMMKRMGYDAVALGNHEFDLGPGALAQAIASAGDAAPPLVITNVNFDPDDARDDGLAALYGPDKAIAPYRVVTTASGLRVGIVASMGVAAGTVAGSAPPVTFWSGDTNEARFASVATAIFAAAKHLREVEHVDTVILLGHGGIGATPETGEDELLAQKVLGIDLVVSGHTHRSTPAPRMIAAYGREIPVVQAAAYGREVGRVELVFRDDSAVPTLDAARTAFLPVDDRTLPTDDAAFVQELYALTMGFLESGIPGDPGPSFLEATLSRVLGTTEADDPEQLGDLWFKPLGKTSFDVIGLAPGETNAMNLDADAMLAAANGFAPTVAALQASGPIRGDLLVGATQEITFADVYRVVPLGGDPTAGTDLNAIPGYPLVRVLVPTAALRAAIEGTLQQSMLDGDFFVGASGLVVRYDLTRAPYDQAALGGAGPGWVTYLARVVGGVEEVLYDVSNPAFDATLSFSQNPADPTWVQPIVTTYYVASFASAFGIPLVDPTDGQLVSPTNPLSDTILRRGDQSAVKDHEALAAFVKAQCDGNSAEPGFLPVAYSAAVPRRMIDCTGGCP